MAPAAAATAVVAAAVAAGRCGASGTCLSCWGCHTASRTSGTALDQPVSCITSWQGSWTALSDAGPCPACSACSSVAQLFSVRGCKYGRSVVKKACIMEQGTCGLAADSQQQEQKPAKLTRSLDSQCTQASKHWHINPPLEWRSSVRKGDRSLGEAWRRNIAPGHRRPAQP